MARLVSNKDAKSVIKSHQGIINRLAVASNLKQEYKDSITSSVEKIITDEVLNILKDIPVSELSRYAKGVKVKTLMDNNYNTLLDIYNAQDIDLSKINGISDNGENMIKQATKTIITNTQKEIKLKLSTDNKSTNNTRLVQSIYQYTKSLGLAERCYWLHDTNHKVIAQDIQSLTPATTTMKWFFASKLVKQKAEQVYTKLNAMLNGDYGKLTNELLSSLDTIRNCDPANAWKDFEENSVSYFNVLEEISPDVLGNTDLLYGLPEDLAQSVAEEIIYTDGLLCTLRKYQEWGVKYSLHQKRVLLGDEMGLGKTVQAIATMVSLKNTGGTHFLVVCPASVLTNWCREIKKHSNLDCIKVHGDNKEQAFIEWLTNGGVAVTTFETTALFKLEETFKYTMLIVDEAHYIKNPNALRTINTVNLSNHAERMLFMTGTPIENNVDEMIILLNILQPEISQSIKNISYMASAPQFREKIAPVYYRRKRVDVLTELPDLDESQEWCSMTAEEEKVYEESVLNKSFMAVRRLSWNVDDIKHSSKAQRLLEIIEEAQQEERKVIVFSFFLDTIAIVKEILGDKCLSPINGSISPQRRQEIVDEFEKAPVGSVLAAQIQSGGTGLNIQAASVIILCEPQFKPSIENQAISRAYRMGQTRDVLVYRLLCEDTIDEKIIKLLEEKQAIFDAFADKSVAAEQNLELDEKTFGTIIQEETERIQQKHQKD